MESVRGCLKSGCCNLSSCTCRSCRLDELAERNVKSSIDSSHLDAVLEDDSQPLLVQSKTGKNDERQLAVS